MFLGRNSSPLSELGYAQQLYLNLSATTCELSEPSRFCLFLHCKVVCGLRLLYLFSGPAYLKAFTPALQV